MDYNELMDKKSLFDEKIKLVQMGNRAYEDKTIEKAVEAFESYLTVMEEIKNISKGELLPSQFDREKEVSELFVLSGIYWNLAKIYDGFSSIEEQEKFQHYLKKYILFSQEKPYQAICAAAVKRWIYHGRPVHCEAFQKAYQRLTDSQCFIVSSLVGFTQFKTLENLSQFKNQVLLNSPFGRKLVQVYYKNGPKWAQWMNAQPKSVRWLTARFLDFIAWICTYWTKN